MASRDKEVPSKVFAKKNLFQKPVTLRKINIFLWDFFKTISTRSENFISGVFQGCSATNKKLWTIKVVKQKLKNHFFHEIKISNHKFRFWISGKPQKWSFQREYNINIQFLIAKISFQLKKWKFWKKYLKKNQNLTKIWNFHFCLITLMVHNFFLVAEHPWKTPEMEFLYRLDMV